MWLLYPFTLDFICDTSLHLAVSPVNSNYAVGYADMINNEWDEGSS